MRKYRYLLNTLKKEEEKWAVEKKNCIKACGESSVFFLWGQYCPQFDVRNCC